MASRRTCVRDSGRDVAGWALPDAVSIWKRRARGMASVELERRSIYLLRGDARTKWQHMIPPAKLRHCDIRSHSARCGGLAARSSHDAHLILAPSKGGT